MEIRKSLKKAAALALAAGTVATAGYGAVAATAEVQKPVGITSNATNVADAKKQLDKLYADVRSYYYDIHEDLGAKEAQEENLIKWKINKNNYDKAYAGYSFKVIDENTKKAIDGATAIPLTVENLGEYYNASKGKVVWIFEPTGFGALAMGVKNTSFHKKSNEAATKGLELFNTGKKITDSIAKTDESISKNQAAIKVCSEYADSVAKRFGNKDLTTTADKIRDVLKDSTFDAMGYAKVVKIQEERLETATKAFKDAWKAYTDISKAKSGTYTSPQINGAKATVAKTAKSLQDVVVDMYQVVLDQYGLGDPDGASRLKEVADKAKTSYDTTMKTVSATKGDKALKDFGVTPLADRLKSILTKIEDAVKKLKATIGTTVPPRSFL